MVLRDFLEYLENRRFVKLYESNPENYEPCPDRYNVSCLKVSSRYCSASVDASLHRATQGIKWLEKIIKESIKKTA